MAELKAALAATNRAKAAATLLLEDGTYLLDVPALVVQNYWAPMEYRFAGCSNLVFQNNLVNRPLQRRDNAPPAQQSHNLDGLSFILNQHVEPAFRFSPAQVARMRVTLRQRIPLLTELLPFDDPNYGLDESWAVVHPHWVTRRPGDTALIELRITNHSAHEQTFRAALHAPEGFRVARLEPARIAAHTDGVLKLTVAVPGDCIPGLHVEQTQDSKPWFGSSPSRSSV